MAPTSTSMKRMGTTLRYSPGQIIGGDGLAHTCPPSRCVTYFLEGLLLLAPLAKQPLSIRLKGVTNGGPDVSCDTFRTATLPLLAKFGISEQLVFKIQKRGAPPLGGGEVVFSCPTLKGIQPLELLDEGKAVGAQTTDLLMPFGGSTLSSAARRRGGGGEGRGGLAEAPPGIPKTAS
ncbi:unnamed protein product [Prorocentrum cordatum]|uniref:RNA 3'-terminal phosphate cyclase domain-containing protein n=1 Tax=Prorocentrum cordatum TaxID=2364126 RepID=A0ABN9QCN8_9DINO|nr:unnamed protein product [Polarella glacialis]